MRTAVLVSCLVLLAHPGHSEEGLDARIRRVLPRPEEDKWLAIPWRSSLAKARAEANEKGKPIFIWLMNGNPLGCL